MKSLTLTGKTSAAGDLTYYLLKSTKSLLLTSDARALDQLLRAAARTPCKQTALSPRFVHSRYWHFVLGVNSKLQIIPSRLAFSVNLRLCFSVTKQRGISPSGSPFAFPAGAIVLCAFETMV